MSGFFITFEGGDGSGKTTQARELARRLEAAGHRVKLTREPGGTPLGGVFRAALLHPEETLATLAHAELASGVELAEPMLPLTEALLLSADRTQHVALIRKWLVKGNIVISDRYADATLAYQGYGRNFDLATLRTLQTFATGGLTPDLTLLLDLPVEIGFTRRLRRGRPLQLTLLDDQTAVESSPKLLGHEDGELLNRLDNETREFHERVNTGYRTLADEEPDRWVTLDATQGAKKLADEIWKEVSQRLGIGLKRRRDAHH